MDANVGKKKIIEKICVICPSCQGTGFLDSNPDSSLPLIHRKKNNLTVINHDPRKIKAGIGRCQDSLETLQLPCVEKRSKEVNFQDLSLIMENFLEKSSKIGNPSEMLKQASQKLRLNSIDDNVLALKNILCLSKCHPKLVEPVMSTVYRKLSSLLQNTRPQIVSVAAQISAQFFVIMHYAQRPEFDELATTIIQKTAHLNKQVKENSNKALDAMISYIPSSYCVFVLTSSQTAGHKSPDVRATVSRLIESVVKEIGEENLLYLPNMRSTRRKIFMTLANFLIDGNQNTRLTARRLIKNFLCFNDFENYFYQDIDLNMFKKIKKDFITLKYEQTNG